MSTNIDIKEETQVNTEINSSTSKNYLANTTSKPSIKEIRSVVPEGKKTELSSSNIATTNPEHYSYINTDKTVPTTIIKNPSTEKISDVWVKTDNESKKIPKYTIESINQEDCEETWIFTFLFLRQ